MTRDRSGRLVLHFPTRASFLSFAKRQGFLLVELNVTVAEYLDLQHLPVPLCTYRCTLRSPRERLTAEELLQEPPLLPSPLPLLQYLKASNQKMLRRLHEMQRQGKLIRRLLRTQSKKMEALEARLRSPEEATQ